MWELRQEGNRLALYFLGEYQFRMTASEALDLFDTLANSRGFIKTFADTVADANAEKQQKADGEKFMKEHPNVPVVDVSFSDDQPDGTK